MELLDAWMVGWLPDEWMTQRELKAGLASLIINGEWIKRGKTPSQKAGIDVLPSEHGFFFVCALLFFNSRLIGLLID